MMDFYAVVILGWLAIMFWLVAFIIVEWWEGD